MKIDGACLCGHVSYEAQIDPNKVTICHCTDCQINSATAFRYGAPVAKENFQLKGASARWGSARSAAHRSMDAIRSNRKSILFDSAQRSSEANLFLVFRFGGDLP